MNKNYIIQYSKKNSLNIFSKMLAFSDSLQKTCEVFYPVTVSVEAEVTYSFSFF